MGLPISGFTFDSTNRVNVNASLGANTVSAANSSIVPLGIAGVFAGAYVQVLDYAQVSIIVYADQDGTLTVTESSDGVNADKVTNFGIESTLAGQVFPISVNSEYVKVGYTNGAVAQTVFRLETLLKPVASPQAMFQLDYVPTDDDLAPLTRSRIYGKYSGDGLYYNLEIDNSGAVVTKPNATGKLQFWFDGALQDVIEDTVTPANNRPLPVKLTDITGDINITAGDLNVQLSHAGASYDSTRIGDGTDLLEITTAGEALTSPRGTVIDQDPDDATAPLKVGAIYRAAQPTYTDGDRTTLHTDINGNLKVAEISVAGGGVADNAVDSGNPMKVGTRVSAGADAYALGDRADMQSTQTGHLYVYDKTWGDLNTSFDLDTGAGTQNVLGTILRKAAGGGSVAFGTTTDPIITNDETLNAKLKTWDLDTGAGTDNNLGVNLRLSAGGGSVEAGTDTNPFVTAPKGLVSHNAADSGNPIKVGAVYNAAAPTLDDGDRSDLQVDVNGQLKTTATLSGGNVADNAADSGNPIKIGGVYHLADQVYGDGDRADLQMNSAGHVKVYDQTWNGNNTSYDLDTGAGTQMNLGVVLRRGGAGGSVEAGTATYPLFVSTDAAVANNAADSGNPTKVGGVYNAALPTLDAGDRGDLQLTVSGQLHVYDKYAVDNNAVFDLDTGGGTQNVLGVSLRKSGAGGSVELGTVSNPLVVQTSGSSAGRTKVDLIRNDYSSTSVTTAAYVQLVASTSADINKLQVFDSSGETLVIAVGAAAAEVNQFYIFPGGNGEVELYIPSGSRISVKAISANATAGELTINTFS